MNVRNEVAALTLARNTLLAVLRSFPTTAEEDDALLAGSTKPRHCMALRYRRSKKGILLWHVRSREM